MTTPTQSAYQAEDLARRNSLSLLNRTPPYGSLASELLGLDKEDTTQQLLARAEKSLLNVKELTETLSNYNSCVSSLPSSSSGENSETENSPKLKGLKKEKEGKHQTKQKN